MLPRALQCLAHIFTGSFLADRPRTYISCLLQCVHKAHTDAIFLMFSLQFYLSALSFVDPRNSVKCWHRILP